MARAMSEWFVGYCQHEWGGDDPGCEDGQPNNNVNTAVSSDSVDNVISGTFSTKIMAIFYKLHL